jgi:hypothetical protein
VSTHTPQAILGPFQSKSKKEEEEYDDDENRFDEDVEDDGPEEQGDGDEEDNDTLEPEVVDPTLAEQDAQLLENLGWEVDELLDERLIDLLPVSDVEWAEARAAFIKV